MECFVPKARVLGAGTYDVDAREGQSKPRYLDVYSPDHGQLRLSVHRECPTLDSMEFGTVADLRCELSPSEKYVRGEERDRSVKGLRVVVREFTIAAAQPRPVKAAA